MSVQIFSTRGEALFMIFLQECFITQAFELGVSAQKRTPCTLAIGSIFNLDCDWRWLEIKEQCYNNFRINVYNNMMDNFELLAKECT